MYLQLGSGLQNGKYEIIRTLGQGGFGITYEAEQVALRRKVAIKEFFMKEYCERDGATSHVTLGATAGSKEIVARFRTKFIREAQMIAGLEHPHIVKIYDVFEENGTAYYVMEYLEGESLSDRVKKSGAIPEEEALKYIRQVASALSYIHGRNSLHFDVKPSNILVNKAGDAILIDFGVSKHYDEAGNQTSSTPVGISKGYAPMEQYQQSEIGTFTPATDIYALGATLYTLLTGKVPPSASEVNEDGLPPFPIGVSKDLQNAIEKAMSPRRKDRPQSIDAFLALLDAKKSSSTHSDSDETVVPSKSKPESKPVRKTPETLGEKPKSKAWLWALLACAIVAAIITAIVLGGRKEKPGVDELTPPVDTTVIAPTAEQIPSSSQKPETKPEPVVPGSVKVSSTPSGATIWLDGKNMKKKTPEIIEDLTPGKHSVKLVLEGYNDYSGNITVASGKRAEISQTLREKEKLVAVETPVPVETPAPVEKPMSASINGHEWVDLGLSVKWATCNVGASSPSDYGSYFAWGETKPKSEYTWSNLRYCADNSGDSFTKYNTDSQFGTVDNKKKLELTDDAARQNWGGSWRMPTDAELTELREKCTWTLTTQGGKNGYRVTSKTNGNSIFLPAAGYRREASFNGAGTNGNYWSSSLSTDNPCSAWYLSFYSAGVYRSYDYRYNGVSVRPVTE